MGAKLEECLKKKKLRVSTEVRQLVKKELSAALDDFREAQNGLKRKAYKWTTIQSYYSMFHSARALLYEKSYRERSHYCLRIALEEFYVIPGLLPQHIIDALQVAKELRENADYESHFSESGARKLVKAAKEFLEYAKKLTSS